MELGNVPIFVSPDLDELPGAFAAYNCASQCSVLRERIEKIHFISPICGNQEIAFSVATEGAWSYERIAGLAGGQHSNSLTA
jgi:hypothetical protein